MCGCIFNSLAGLQLLLPQILEFNENILVHSLVQETFPHIAYHIIDDALVFMILCDILRH